MNITTYPLRGAVAAELAAASGHHGKTRSQLARPVLAHDRCPEKLDGGLTVRRHIRNPVLRCGRLDDLAHGEATWANHRQRGEGPAVSERRPEP